MSHCILSFLIANEEIKEMCHIIMV